jgi:glycosyltransferase involved in cell wall biosynthesis
MKPTISIVLPIYNEIANLKLGVIDQVIKFAKTNSQIKEILVVDDGSTDLSVEHIKKHYLQKASILKLINKEHSGKAFTVIKGIETATADYVLFSDMDLATPIEEADKLIAEINNHFQIIIGSRKKGRKGAPLIRKIMALGFMYIRNFAIGLKGITDTQCGFKLFEKQAAIKIINKLRVFKAAKNIHGSSVGAGFDLEFLFLANKLGYKIKEVPVTWRHVETKRVSFVKDSLETLWDIAKIKQNELLNRY